MTGNMIAKAHGKTNDEVCDYGCCHSSSLHHAVSRGSRSASKSKQEIHQIQRSREKASLRKQIQSGE